MKQIENWIPEARFIHMIRDGRDAALSRFKRVLKEPPPMETVAERWVQKIEGARADGAGPRTTSRSSTRSSSATPRRSCAGSAEFLELPWDDSMLRYYERAEERLAEMHRDLPGEDGKPLRPADHRKEAHVLTSKPPDPSRLARWKEDMDPEPTSPPSRASPRRCCSSSATRWSARRERRARRARRALASEVELARRRSTSTRPPAGPVRRRPDPLGHDAAADDARRPPRADDPARDPLRPRPDQGRAGRRRAPTAMLAALTDNRTWGDFGIDAEEMRERLDAASTPATAPRRSAPSSTPTPSARASRAGATRRPPTCSPSSGSAGRCPSPASST